MWSSPVVPKPTHLHVSSHGSGQYSQKLPLYFYPNPWIAVMPVFCGHCYIVSSKHHHTGICNNPKQNTETYIHTVVRVSSNLCGWMLKQMQNALRCSVSNCSSVLASKNLTVLKWTSHRRCMVIFSKVSVANCVLLRVGFCKKITNMTTSEGKAKVYLAVLNGHIRRLSEKSWRGSRCNNHLHMG